MHITTPLYRLAINLFAVDGLYDQALPYDFRRLLATYQGYFSSNET